LVGVLNAASRRLDVVNEAVFWVVPLKRATLTFVPRVVRHGYFKDRVRRSVDDYLRAGFKLPWFIFQRYGSVKYLRVVAVTTPTKLIAIAYAKLAGIEKSVNTHSAALVEFHFDIKSFSLRSSSRTAVLTGRGVVGRGRAAGSTFCEDMPPNSSGCCRQYSRYICQFSYSSRSAGFSYGI